MGVSRPRRACDSKEVYLKMKIRGKEESCLLDTGSDVNLVPLRLAKGLNLQPSRQQLAAANGTKIDVLGAVTLIGWAGPRQLTVDGLVSDNVDEVMLGVDWLQQNGASWSFSKDELRIGDSVYPLVSMPATRNVRRVVSQSEVVIEPRSQVNMHAKVVYHNPFAEMDDPPVAWMTEPTEAGVGLHVAGTLVPDRSADVPVRVMNLLHCPITVPVGTILSELTPVDDCQPFAAEPVDNTNPDISHLDTLVEEADELLSAAQRKDLRTLLGDYEDVFSRSEFDLGSTDVVTHSIDTGLNRPVKQQVRRHPFTYDEAIREQTSQMIEQGIVEPSHGEWRSNVVLVKKKDGSLRFCIDYRRLNDITRKDVYPLPRIDTCLDALAGARWFSTFDLRSGYHQVKMNAMDKDKTAFVTRDGTFRFRVMPFGLCNAGATFQRLMDVIMSGLNFDICLVYLDDIVLFSSTVEEHFSRLKLLLVRLRDANLKLKPSKCELFRRQVEFLGHVVSGEGIATSPSKIQAVSEWPTPRSVKDVRAFIGLASYYRRFVQGFAEVAAPLHALTGKEQSFLWDDRCQVAFQQLKQALTVAPVLAMPLDGEPYILDTDDSNHGIGAVLSQVQNGMERPIAYASRTYNRPEKNYCVTRKELLAVVYFLKRFQQYLLGRPFVVRTDHAALQWLRRTPDVIGQQSRWLETMEEFQFVVEHRPGIRHRNADALSRRPCTKKGCCDVQGDDNDTGQGTLKSVRGVVPAPVSDELCYDDPALVAIHPPGSDQVVNNCSDVDVVMEVDNDEVNPICGPSSAKKGVAGREALGSLPIRQGLVWTWSAIATAQRNDPELSVVVRLQEEHSEKPHGIASAFKTRE
jgi:predicted aspartyl protease